MESNAQADQVIRYVYVHIPFCIRKCSYCSFYSEPQSAEATQKFVTDLIKEINKFQQSCKIQPETIYFGGGTPSLLKAEQINKIISQFDISNIKEITLECNPININKQFVRELQATKINRISLGAQSFIDNELKLLGRLHDVQQLKKAYEFFRKFDYNNISLDLIYGLPDQSIKDVETSINEIIRLEPEHVSTYCLSLEEDVPLFKKRDRIADDEVISDFYYLIRNRLISAGFSHYEISNFAKSGFRSKHNLCYWEDKKYIGLGPSAAGYLGKFRYNNPADLNEYYKQITKDNIMKNKTILTLSEHEKEFIFLGLRKSKGINLKEYKHKFKDDFELKYCKTLKKYENLIELDDETVKLKPKAYFISNEIFSEFM